MPITNRPTTTTAAPLDPRWQLQPAPWRSRVWLAVLTIALPLALAGSGVLQETSAGPRLPLALAAIGGVLVFASIDALLRRHRLELDGERLDVVTTFYRRSFPLGELRLDAARVVDLAERTEYQPRLGTNGTHLPGFHSGRFRLRNRSMALVAIAGGPRVLWLPTARGFDLLLQPRQPHALLQHLREVAGVSARS